MKWIKKHWRGLALAIALPLFGVGLFCGYWWFYKLAPIRHTHDPEWYASHSPKEYWNEIQKGIHQGMWSHDDGFTVGYYGDKTWAEWIMTRVTSGTSMGCMGAGLTHSATSMQYITNQDIGEEADDWLVWWSNHKDKTQREWIADGFHQKGIMITMPPKTGDVPTLLELLGRAGEKENYSLPGALKYNAFRSLRDSGFQPVVYALENQQISEDIKKGLIEYSQMEKKWPSEHGVGLLPFSTYQDDWGWAGIPLPLILTTRFQITAHALIFGVPSIGALFLIMSMRKRGTKL